MEEIEYKLKQKNAILITEAISKLIDKIKIQKNNDKNIPDLNIKELQLLKARCGVEDTLVSVTASHGIVYLVEQGFLSPETTLSDLMLNLSYAKFQTGIFTAIGKLLLLTFKRDLEKGDENYICPFKMLKPQHPLITLLTQNSEMWREILNQIQLFMNNHDKKIAVNSIKLLRPVFYYVFCDPLMKSPDSFRKQLWTILLMKSDMKEYQILILELVLWMQIKSELQCLETHDFLIEAIQFATKNGNNKLCASLLIYLISLMHRLVKCGSDPSRSIATITEVLQNNFKPIAVSSVLLIILADTINICPPIYLTDLLLLCKIIISNRSSNIFAVKSLKSSILQWLFNPSNLLSEEIKIIHEIIILIENNDSYTAMTKKLSQDIYFSYVQNADTYIDFIVKLNVMAEKWQSQLQTKNNNKLLLESWLDYVFKNMPAKSLKKYFTILSAIFINDNNNSAINKKALNILLKFNNSNITNNDISYNILILILFKLSNETDPELLDALLKALPLLAISKHNIPIIINTLESIKNSPTYLKTYSFSLYLSLWDTDVRCFPYLQKLLMENQNSWEFGIAKAYTLKEICVRRPVLHGKEMVIHLSQILNQYKDEKGRIASSLALEGITVLCEAVIIDIISTWRTLAPRLETENHPIIIKSLCEFFSQFSNLRCISKQDEQIVSEIISKLWNYVSSSNDFQIIEHALKALSCFMIRQMSLKQIPNKYKENLKIPLEIVKTLVDVEKVKAEDVLPYIPGECWIQLLEKVPAEMLNAVGNMLIEWTRIEIAEFNSQVYYVSENMKKEVVNYNIFPKSSIVRTLISYLQIYNNNHSESSKPIVRQILRVLGEPYSKPLPPLDWKFLSALFQKDPEYECLCINVLCKQLLISTSAIYIVKHWIKTFIPDMKKVNNIRTLFTNLNYLCKAVPPDNLQPFIVNTLNLIRTTTEKNDDISIDVANSIRSTIVDEDIQESNRTLLGEAIESFMEQLNVNDKMFDIFLPCILNASPIYIDRLSSPSLWWNEPEDKFEKGIKLRCALAIKKTENPFACLTECINAAATLSSMQIITLTELSEVFRHHHQHASTIDWILKCLGGIQEKIIVQDKNSKEIVFLCDVLLIAIIIFSNLDVLYSPVDMICLEQDARLDVFPNALYVFVSNHQTLTSQVLEWLYHMIKGGAEIPEIYKITFSKSLTMLRHEKAFYDSSLWMKYVSVEL